MKLSGNLFVLILLIYESHLIGCGKCPGAQYQPLFTPCICINDTTIICESIENIDLKQIFDYFSKTLNWKERHFKSLTINCRQLLELQELTFGDLTFDNILVTNGQNLRQIHTNAFGATRLTLKNLTIEAKGQLVSISNGYNLFEAIGSLINIENINISGLNIYATPDYAIKPLLGNQWALKNLTINGTIHRIGKYAFYDSAYHLKHISIGNQIEYISSHAFDMRIASFERLTIDLSGNQLTGNSFEGEVFLNTKRTIYLDLSNNKLSHLDEFIFDPFLSLDIMNIVNVSGNFLHCDCRMKWLAKNRLKYKRQVVNALCSDGRPFWEQSLDEFNECKHNEIIDS
ncbi:uncharacterized protein LOC128957961 [Oppia nitens]|uniref:uncharacterized protein LOC128957961 n=1 Tax=Oppia nitens TaxID=1686743 RepID=UPI0023DBE285|nr:uncharacterized protein LOC128957961 [Oppia nitens]